jgi:hypothetical protein
LAFKKEGEGGVAAVGEVVEVLDAREGLRVSEILWGEEEEAEGFVGFCVWIGDGQGDVVGSKVCFYGVLVAGYTCTSSVPYLSIVFRRIAAVGLPSRTMLGAASGSSRPSSLRGPRVDNSS